MSAIITVENVSKKYIIGHQMQQRYVALRDVLANKARQAFIMLRHPLGGFDRHDSGHEEFWALKDISFEVMQGDRLGIIGHNGAGKSTILKILSRITGPTTGRIHIKGRVASLLEVGTGFHPELTGRENIFLNGAILGMTGKEIKAKFDEIVDFAEVETFLDTPVKRYSSGMYVRLAFSIASHLEPEILVVDEVLAVGDAQFQKKCLGKMEEVGKEGRTVLFVSHNMGAIQHLTNQALLLRHGEIAYTGDAGKAVAKYLSPESEDRNEEARDIRTNDQYFLVKKISPYNNSTTPQFNNPLSFSITLKISRQYRNLSVAIGVYNSLGSRLLTAKSIIDPVETGDSQLICTIKDHHLPPGNYHISLGIAVSSQMILYKENVISFSISDEGMDNDLLIPYLANHRDKIGAFYELKYEWAT